MTEQPKQAAQQIGATAEYWGNLAQQKADADAKRGVSMPVSYYASTVVGALLAANPALTAAQPAQAGCNHVLYETADADRPKEICDQNGEVVLAMCKLCGKAESELEAAQPAAQATPEPLTLGPLAKRNIYDAIRGAYDLGYNDARNARTVPGDSAPGYDGRSVEEDHGGALFNLLSKRLTPATPEPVDWKPIKTSAGGREAVRSFFRSTLKRHDFDDYITGALAADFACVLGGYLQATATPTQQAAGEPVGEVRIAHYGGRSRSIGFSTIALFVDIETLPVGTKLYTHPAPGVPEIDYSALIHAAWGKHKYAQGTGGCIAFKRGAEWFRDIALAAAQAKGGE